jgi:hypothetical protein
MKKLLFVALACLLVASMAQAQVVTNPRTVEFTVQAPDYASTSSYELRHFLVGATAPVQTQDLGKPTPDGTGKISAAITALPISLTNQYYAKVAALSPAGEGVSAASPQTYFFVSLPAGPTNVNIRK